MIEKHRHSDPRALQRASQKPVIPGYDWITFGVRVKALTIEVDFSLPVSRVVRILEQLIE